MDARPLALFLLAGVLAAGATGASVPAQAPAATTSAGAFGITVVLPGQTGTPAAEATAPGTPSAALDAFVHPADGSAVRTGALSSSAAARAGGKPFAQSVADLLALALFNGEVTADSVASRASASPAGANANGAGLTNLVVLGQPIAPTANQRLPLGDWGYAIALEQALESSVADGIRTARASVTALRVVLTADHGGLPAGTEILVGHTEASTTSPITPATRPGTSTTVTTSPSKPARPAGVPPKGPKKKLPKAPEPDTLPGKPGSIFRIPPQDVSAPLSPEGYVFPVYGPSSFVDTFGAPRAGVVWHHGEDIFAPLGAPILAVADGTVFSVGWNDRGGYRFWLRDRQGNQFYYAHLSAYSPLAVDGTEVRAGSVIGFVGNTGDAQSTPYHLHFEIHPVGLLPLGYDGVVNPFAYLSAWRRLQDVSFAAGRGWAPPVPANATAPHAAAFLLGSTDISTASGLEPGSLDRALTAPVSAEGDGALIRAG